MIGEIDDAILSYFKGFAETVLGIDSDHVILSLSEEEITHRHEFERRDVSVTYPFMVVTRSIPLEGFVSRSKMTRCVDLGIDGSQDGYGAFVWAGPVAFNYIVRLYTDCPDQLNQLYTAWYFSTGGEQTRYKPTVMEGVVDDWVPITFLYDEPEAPLYTVLSESRESGYKITQDFLLKVNTLMFSERFERPRAASVTCSLVTPIPTILATELLVE